MYSVSEGQASAEVCAVASAMPISGQPVLVLISTEDGTATGKLHSPFTDKTCHSLFLLQVIRERVSIITFPLQLAMTTLL